MTNLEYVVNLINLMTTLTSYVEKSKDCTIPYSFGSRHSNYRNEISINDYNSGDGYSVIYHFKTLNINLCLAHFIAIRINPEFIKIRFYDDNEIIIDASDINILNDETLFVLTYGNNGRGLLNIPFTEEDKNDSISFMTKIKHLF